MKPLTYFEQIIKMPNKADKFDLRLRIVKHAIANGIKPTARVFDTTPPLIKKVRPKMTLALVRLPPLMLDWLGPDYITRDELSLRGHDVPCYP